MHACIHSYISTHARTYARTHAHTHTRTHAHTHTRTHAHTHTHTRTHAHTHTRTHAHTHTRTHAHTHTRTHTHIHAHALALACTGTHTRTCARHEHAHTHYYKWNVLAERHNHGQVYNSCTAPLCTSRLAALAAPAHRRVLLAATQTGVSRDILHCWVLLFSILLTDFIGHDWIIYYYFYEHFRVADAM